MKANLSNLCCSWQTVINPSVWLSAELFNWHSCSVDSSRLSSASKAAGRAKPGTTGVSREGTPYINSMCVKQSNRSYLLRSSECAPFIRFTLNATKGLIPFCAARARPKRMRNTNMYFVKQIKRQICKYTSSTNARVYSDII